ncbi:IS66 family insertion sequence element accessory protein TnpB [Salmonella enterica]|nr:IS66 family insertion sequence element accessory protein TnpB [Salmonella enterica]EJO2520417.1 IS66 family insertion sequence element accessory protein TnpB [Salmonella enterica]
MLDEEIFSGHLFIFRGRWGDTVKILWADGLCLFTKRLPVTSDCGPLGTSTYRIA